MKDWITEFLKVPYDRRKKISLGKDGYKQKRHKKKNRRKTKSFTKEEVMEFLKDNYVLTKERLIHINDVDDDSPSVYYVLKHFGDWNKMLEEVYGIHQRDRRDEEIISLLITFNIKKQEDYQKRRSLEPNLFPSVYFIKKRFGSWQNLKRLSQGMIVEGIVERYIVLKAEKKRWPTKKECEQSGIEIDRVLKYMNQNELKEIIAMLEERML